MHRFPLPIAAVTVLGLLVASLQADEAVAVPDGAESVAVELAEGGLAVAARADWRRVKPRNNLIEVEFAAPGEAAAGDETDASAPAARLTIMAASGGVDRNVDRWIDQFRDIEMDAKGESARIAKREVGGMRLHTVDIRGTFLDAPRGPFGPKTPKPDHRMLAGILETEDYGHYYFKLVGPKPVVEHNAEAFQEMLDSARNIAP